MIDNVKYSFFILVIGVLSSCFTTNNKNKTAIVSNQVSPRILGDTSFTIWNRGCEYVVEAISKKITLPDSLKNREYFQNPKVGDTIKKKCVFNIELYFKGKQQIDTFLYQVKIYEGTSHERLFISPNGDGINDCWEIPELVKYPNNIVKLFNRWGHLVYEKEGYIDQFCGVANVKITSQTGEIQSNILPEATYYYIIDLGDTKIEPYTGDIQIKR